MPLPNLPVLMVQLQYPGMTWAESDIMRAWLAAHGEAYDSIEFNVRLGGGTELGPEYSDSTRRLAQAVTQLRSDFVVIAGGAVTLGEVKVRIGLPVIGQLLGYRTLYRQAHPDVDQVRLVAIGRSVMEDVRAAIQEHGVEIEVYPRASARSEL